MTPSKLAKILLFLSSGAGAAVFPKWECGTYEVEGTLLKNDKSFYVLSVNHKTSNRWELLLLGGKVREKDERLGSKVRVQIYNPKPLDLKNPQVFFQKFTPLEDKPWRIVAAEKCKLKEKYRE